MEMMRSHYWMALTVVTLFLTLGYSVFSNEAMPGLWKKRLREEYLNQRALSLFKKISQISEEVELLSGDSASGLAYIKQVAREELGMIGAGEVLMSIDFHRTNKGRTDSHEKNLHP